MAFIFCAFFRENEPERKGMNKEKVYTYLAIRCRGRKNSLSTQALEASLHIRRSDLQKQIGKLRREGVPIASSSAGYFYAENAAEIYSTIRLLERMRQGLDASIKGLEQAMEKFGGDS